ncbi:hypothetical protein MKK65_00740 [Methylobacterium sp. J-001]|uniref:hypothetical protein n=1 Tax=Methylobacterium sp. J-001 TaxID=2836609 RepID=UPI001FB9D36A|nr:hypothetical protein [Methylobacterium sp. J-001]MCJ2115138.1 hypothetical protein [Methylobacterium sp. J-001]
MSVLAMALFRDLISSVAQAEGLSEMTVTGIGQYLRDAGYISKHGRGKAAAQMTSADAANLLIGVNASDLAKNAVEAVKSYSELRIVREGKNGFSDKTIGAAFSRSTTLANAIRIVIESFIPSSDGRTPFDTEIGASKHKVEIGFGRPVASAFISVSEVIPPSPVNPFLWLEQIEPICFGHFWASKQIWTQVSGRRDLTIISSGALTMIGNALSA